MMNLMHVAFILLMLPLFPDKEKYLLIGEKRIIVQGNTSMGKFNCVYTTSGKSDMLFLNNPEKESTYPLVIQAAEFECGNFFLNKDFQKTIKSKTYPQIYIEVEGFYQNPVGELSGNLWIGLAGISKNLGKVKFTNSCPDGVEIISTEIDLNITEFGLEPPAKLAGLFKAEEVVHVTVELVLNL